VVWNIFICAYIGIIIQIDYFFRGVETTNQFIIYQALVLAVVFANLAIKLRPPFTIAKLTHSSLEFVWVGGCNELLFMGLRTWGYNMI